MKKELTAQILDLEQGDHLCLFYQKDPAEQMAALVPFIQEGLRRDEQFIYVADDQTVDQLTAHLKQGGIDVKKEARRGRLKLWTRQEWRQPGELSSVKKALQVREIFREASAAGFKGIRLAVETTWVLGPDISATRLKHWEATINTIFTPGFPGRIICQYNCTRLAPEVLLAGLHTHPLAVLEDEVCQNAFYEGPLILNGAAHQEEPGQKAGAGKVQWMLSQIRRVRAAENRRAETMLKRAAQAQTQSVQAKVEQTLLESRAHLEERVAERTAKLKETISELEAFSSTISHDLRLPLRAIQSFSQILVDDFSDKLGPEGAHYARRIASASVRLDQLIQEVLAYSRVSRTEAPLHEVDAEALICELVQQQPALQPPHARVEIAGGIPNVLGHKALLTQSFSNLIGNAVKFVPPSRSPHVRIRSESVGSQVRIWFEDNGIGLDPRDQSRIWGLFERVHSKEFEGTGLGLAIVRRAVEKMGGQTGVESELGQGCRFWIQLAKASREEINHRSKPPARRYRRRFHLLQTSP